MEFVGLVTNLSLITIGGGRTPVWLGWNPEAALGQLSCNQRCTRSVSGSGWLCLHVLGGEVTSPRQRTGGALWLPQPTHECSKIQNDPVNIGWGIAADHLTRQ